MNGFVDLHKNNIKIRKIRWFLLLILLTATVCDPEDKIRYVKNLYGL